jgi:hypothetical protein
VGFPDLNRWKKIWESTRVLAPDEPWLLFATLIWNMLGLPYPAFSFCFLSGLSIASRHSQVNQFPYGTSFSRNLAFGLETRSVCKIMHWKGFPTLAQLSLLVLIMETSIL